MSLSRAAVPAIEKHYILFNFQVIVPRTIFIGLEYNNLWHNNSLCHFFFLYFAKLLLKIYCYE